MIMERVLTLVLLCVLSAWANIPDVEKVSVIGRTETELTFQWKVENSSYSYKLATNVIGDIPINASEAEYLNYTVSPLSPGTNYSFTLYTVFENYTSKGFYFSNVTTPSNVNSVSVIDRKENQITLQWSKVNNSNDYGYELYWNEENSSIPISQTNTVEYNVTSLDAGTEYFFTLYTVFGHVMSSGYSFTNVTMPSNVQDVNVKLNDTEMILQWDVVSNTNNNTYTYTLENKDELTVNCTNQTAEGNEVTCHISDLTPATNYSFTLYTEFADLRSTGFKFNNITTLSDITEVTVNRSQTELTISWNKLNNNDIYNYTLKSQGEGSEKNFTGSAVGDVITHTYSSLTPGTEHSFTLFTVVNKAFSRGFSFKNVTTLYCTSFNWTVTNSSIEAKVNGSTYVKAQNSTGSVKNGTVNQNSLTLQGLYPGGSYNVSLFYYLESELLPQCTHHLTLDPYSVSHLRCEYHSGGYGLAVIWDTPYGVVDRVQVDVDRKSFNKSYSSEKQIRLEINGLQAAKKYTVTATSFSGSRRSQTVSVNCETDPAGVIAGVLVFFLLVIIICVAVFAWRRYGSAKRNKMTNPLVEPKVPNKNYKPLPLNKFPEHYQNMSRDENRGFSEEYEDLSSVGIEQSNDSSRVHLTTKDEGDSDYINANYMPGYGNASRQYIAAQGPLPSTVNDFWRMVWEKGSQAIVMLTNCIESGRVKCEQYWPLDYTPCLYGNLLVTVKSEDKLPNWTLREFNVKNSQYVFLHQCIMDSLQPKAGPKSEPLYENSDMIYVNAIALKEYDNQSQI
ncbi:hypothetical protein cypCar_00019606 [Cyprinus carpio]|nr:hypothetical protein cypCar_00019606 [Cyprinus carpio]